MNQQHSRIPSAPCHIFPCTVFPSYSTVFLSTRNPSWNPVIPSFDINELYFTLNVASQPSVAGWVSKADFAWTMKCMLPSPIPPSLCALLAGYSSASSVSCTTTLVYPTASPYLAAMLHPPFISLYLRTSAPSQSFYIASRYAEQLSCTGHPLSLPSPLFPYSYFLCLSRSLVYFFGSLNTGASGHLFHPCVLGLKWIHILFLFIRHCERQEINASRDKNQYAERQTCQE